MNSTSNQPDYSALAMKVESILDIIQAKLTSDVVDLFRGFLNSKEYEIYTNTSLTQPPKGIKILKSKAKGWYQKKKRGKRSHEEFSMEHLEDAKERKKYGKKFLDTLKSLGVLEEAQYDMLLPETRKLYVRSNVPDPLKELLARYYLFPEFDDELQMLDASYSGYKIFDAYVKRFGGLILPIPTLFENIALFKAVRKRQGDAEAMDFFYYDFFPNWMNDAKVMDYAPDRSQQAQLYRFLKKNIQQPLHVIYMNMEEYKAKTAGGNDATTKNMKVMNVDASVEEIWV